jgi:hypothetical protein
VTEITSSKINNIQNQKVVCIDCSIATDNGDILAGLLVVDARTSSPQTITDLSTGFRYSVQLPEQVENQGLVSSLDNCKLMILGFGDVPILTHSNG